ncbi:MAG: crossover junction endodeoxyribonuclease RuvC [Ruminococcaceae bacterium]|nr:crossover junction endodeoxyribonuclease RuvC [Oscillospiraceae bacterium]
MLVLGIDPGYAIVGWGLVDYSGARLSPVAFGAVTTEAGEAFPDRLLKISEDLGRILDKWRPQAISIERLYFNSNTTTAIDVAQARGVIVLEAAKRHIDVFEYTPLQVKQAVVGYGRAEKKQVMEMTRQLLKLKEVPKPDDTADALAIAICHAHSFNSQSFNLLKELGKGVKR